MAKHTSVHTPEDLGHFREVSDETATLLEGSDLTPDKFAWLCEHPLMLEMLRHGPGWARLGDCLSHDPEERFTNAMIRLGQDSQPQDEALSDPQNEAPSPTDQAIISKVCDFVSVLLAGKPLTRKTFHALCTIPAIVKLLLPVSDWMTLSDCLWMGGFHDDMLRLEHESEAAQVRASAKAANRRLMIECGLALKDATDVIVSQRGMPVSLAELGNMHEIKKIRAKAPEFINLKSLFVRNLHYVLLGEGSSTAVGIARMMRA
jgi:hypothetical protein